MTYEKPNLASLIKYRALEAVEGSGPIPGCPESTNALLFDQPENTVPSASQYSDRAKMFLFSRLKVGCGPGRVLLQGVLPESGLSSFQTGSLLE